MRRNRVLQNGATYYITCNINRFKNELKEFFIKEMLLFVLMQAKKKFKFQLNHFIFLDDHVHFIIKPNEKYNLSKVMQWILGVFATRYNKRLKLHGKVWYDRFKSEIIATANNIKDFIKRLNNNIKRFKITNNINNYQFSGIYYKLNKQHDLVNPSLLFF